MGNWRSKSKQAGVQNESAGSEEKPKKKLVSPKQKHAKTDGNKQASNDQYVDMLKAKRDVAPQRRRPRTVAATVVDPAGEVDVSNHKNSPIKTKVIPGAIALAGKTSPPSVKHRSTEALDVKAHDSPIASPVTAQVPHSLQSEAAPTSGCNACPPADQVVPEVEKHQETPQGSKDDADKQPENATTQPSETIQPAASAFRKEPSPVRARDSKSVIDICGNSDKTEETKAKRSTFHSNNTDDHSKATSPALLDFQQIQLQNAETVELESTKL